LGFAYLGIKPEYMLSKRFTITAGIRFFTKKVMLDSDRDYFLWKIFEDEANTDYIKIKSISQRNYYLGVPLEVRFFPNDKDYFARFYIVAGTSLNFLLASKDEVLFSNIAMEKHTSQVLQYIGTPNALWGTLYGGVGVKIGKLDRPCGRIEVHAPVLTYGYNKSNSFTNMDVAGMGFQATFLIPFATKHKLTYTVNN
jgi:hypothetical protein